MFVLCRAQLRRNDNLRLAPGTCLFGGNIVCATLPPTSIQRLLASIVLALNTSITEAIALLQKDVVSSTLLSNHSNPQNIVTQG